MADTPQSTARPNVSIRLSDAGIARLDSLGDETHTDRSKALRAVLTEGLNDPNVMRRARNRLNALTDAV